MAINRELFLKIKQAILDEPRGFQMGGYKKTKDEYNVCRDYGLSWIFPRCGTALCIAGYALHLSGMDADKEQDVHMLAHNLLGVTYQHGDYLFYVDRWPEDLWVRFKQAVTPEERSLIGAEAIDRFLAEEGG